MDDDREVPSGIAVVNALEDCMTANDHSPLLRVADGGGVVLEDFSMVLLLRSRFASEFLYMANGIGFGPVRVVQEHVKFDVASVEFGSFSFWHIEFLYTHVKDSVVLQGSSSLWLCRFLFCLSGCRFVWLGGWVGWLVCWVVDLFGLFFFLFCFGLAWFDLFWFGVVC